MNEPQILGYTANDTFIHRLSGTSKLIYLIFSSIACMTTYDTRFLLIMGVFSIWLFVMAGIQWQQVSFVVHFILVFSLLNIIAVYLFAPQYGVEIYQSKWVIWSGIGRYNLTWQQVFYECNLILKYFCTIPIALIFILTTDPSEFASSLNKLGISYKVSYAVALALRYIPDIQEDFHHISHAQQARGVEMSKKANVFARLKGTAHIIFPLVFSSLDRIETISTAMELRRFGGKKKRTWYVTKRLTKMDFLCIIFSIAVFIISLWLFRVNQGRFYNPFL